MTFRFAVISRKYFLSARRGGSLFIWLYDVRQKRSPFMATPIFDCFSTEYKCPFGAVSEKTQVKFTLRFPKMQNVSEAVFVVFRTGEAETEIPMPLGKDGGIIFSEYEYVYTPEEAGIHWYYFKAKSDGKELTIKREGVSTGSFEGTENFQLTVYAEDMKTPDWIKGGVMYQIFPDRFSIGQEGRPMTPIDRELHYNWHDLPNWKADENGKIRNDDYFGGNLRGIEDKLPYLVSLGVSVIYLNPIFEAHENHRYNTANYEKIDALLGNEKDFTRLCEAARAHGIRIILDGVFSHTGADSVYFNKFGRYGANTGAFRDENSPYREWYSFVKYPEEYDSWWGINTLPNVNENNPSYTRYICGKDGILQKWIDAGASGWRLDVADELPDEFIDNIRKGVKEKGEDKIIYGEVWEDASNKESYGIHRRYLIGNQLDSVMNYPFKECILNYIKTSQPKPFVDGIMTILEHYPKPSVDCLMNFLSTHDTERALTCLTGDDVGWNDREWQSSHELSPEQYIYGIALMKCAMVLQYFLPGIPCVFYADEAGQEGYKDPFNRRTYPWGRENSELVDFARELGQIRRRTKALAKGELKFYTVNEEECVFGRIDREIGEGAIIFLNKSKNSKTYSFGTKLDFCSTFSLTRPKNEAQRKRGHLHVSPFDYEVLNIKLKENNEIPDKIRW